MHYGIKISKKDYNVISGKTGKKLSNKKKQKTSHILSIFAMPYFIGARTQINRYKKATLILKKDSVLGVCTCLHEASCLFEDIATICKYLNKCGNNKISNQPWLDIRNHIRHAFREDFDKNIKEKEKKAKRLGIKAHLQTNITFNKNSIKIGSTEITIKKVNKLLNESEKFFSKKIEKAIKNGYIK